MTPTLQPIHVWHQQFSQRPELRNVHTYEDAMQDDLFKREVHQTYISGEYQETGMKVGEFGFSIQHRPKDPNHKLVAVMHHFYADDRVPRHKGGMSGMLDAYLTGAKHWGVTKVVVLGGTKYWNTVAPRHPSFTWEGIPQQESTDWLAGIQETRMVGKNEIGGWWHNHATGQVHDVSGDAGGGTNDHMGFLWSSEGENGRKLGLEDHHIKALHYAYNNEEGDWPPEANQASERLLQKNTRITSFRRPGSGSHTVGIDTGYTGNRGLRHAQNAIMAVRASGGHLPDHAETYWDQPTHGQMTTTVGDILRAGDHRDVQPIQHRSMESIHEWAHPKPQPGGESWKQNDSIMTKYWYNHDSGNLYQVHQPDNLEDSDYHHINFAMDHPDQLHLDKQQIKNNHRELWKNQGGPTVPHTSTLRNNTRLAVFKTRRGDQSVEMHHGDTSSKNLDHAHNIIMKLGMDRTADVNHLFGDSPHVIQTTVLDTFAAKHFKELDPTHPMFRHQREDVITESNVHRLTELVARGMDPFLVLVRRMYAGVR